MGALKTNRFIYSVHTSRKKKKTLWKIDLIHVHNNQNHLKKGRIKIKKILDLFSNKVQNLNDNIY
jgi:hypothetical protein